MNPYFNKYKVPQLLSAFPNESNALFRAYKYTEDQIPWLKEKKNIYFFFLLTHKWSEKEFSLSILILPNNFFSFTINFNHSTKININTLFYFLFLIIII